MIIFKTEILQDQFTRPRLLEKINENEPTLKNANELLTGGKWVINVFESRVFPMRGVNIDDGDYDYPYIYGDDILYLWWYTKVIPIPRTQGAPRTPTTTPVILESPRIC